MIPGPLYNSWFSGKSIRVRGAKKAIYSERLADEARMPMAAAVDTLDVGDAIRGYSCGCENRG